MNCFLSFAFLLIWVILFCEFLVKRSDGIFRNFMVYFLVLYMRKQYAAAKWNIAHPLDDVSLRRSLICKTFFAGGGESYSPRFFTKQTFSADLEKSSPRASAGRGGTSKKTLPPQANGATGLRQCHRRYAGTAAGLEKVIPVAAPAASERRQDFEKVTPAREYRRDFVATRAQRG